MIFKSELAGARKLQYISFQRKNKPTYLLDMGRKHPSVTRSLFKDAFFLFQLNRRRMLPSLSCMFASEPGLVLATTIDKPTLVTQASRCWYGVARSFPKTPDSAGGRRSSLQTGCSVFAYVNIY